MTVRASITSAALRDIGLFGGISDESLVRLAAELPEVRAEPGKVVVEEGGLSTEMFVVIGGELEVVKRALDGSTVRVAMLGGGDWFGEMAILDVQPRSASVRALAPSLLLSMSADQVDRLLYRVSPKDYSLLVMNIARELSRRLRVADGILAQFFVAMHEQYGKGPAAPR
ncbi:MAG TPA: cyclic nucleotide-binding domain-containing protein [Polyangiales bacterium]|nr:cyclic nucleotide-binding domain-containing protein [Polyangiales bacterium]